MSHSAGYIMEGKQENIVNLYTIVTIVCFSDRHNCFITQNLFNCFQTKVRFKKVTAVLEENFPQSCPALKTFITLLNLKKRFL